MSGVLYLECGVCSREAVILLSEQEEEVTIRVRRLLEGGGSDRVNTVSLSCWRRAGV